MVASYICTFHWGFFNAAFLGAGEESMEVKAIRRRSAAVCAIFALSTVAMTASVRADEIVVPGDSLAVDQPRVLFAVEDPANPGEIFGPSFFNEALLDTGANGILFTQPAYFDIDIFDYNYDYYDVATRSDGSPVQYEEIGVAGTSYFDVFNPYNFLFAGADGNAIEIPQAVILGAPDLDTGSFAGVLGMPLMQHRVTQVNLRPTSQLEFQEVSFHSVQPAATPNTYTVPLSILPPEFPGQVEPTDPVPTYAGLPMLNVSTQAKGNSASNTLILDTGSQFTILSEAMAIQMGLNLDPDDPNNDIIDYLTVGGIGGEVDVPFVQIDRLVIPTQQGTDLVFTDVQVGILDIAGLGGVVGMNILTSGYTDLVFNGADPDQYGVLTDFYLDFTQDDAGVLRLEMNPQFVVPEPASSARLFSGLGCVLLRRKRAS